jgi:hypothetical protein
MSLSFQFPGSLSFSSASLVDADELPKSLAEDFLHDLSDFEEQEEETNDEAAQSMPDQITHAESPNNNPVQCAVIFTEATDLLLLVLQYIGFARPLLEIRAISYAFASTVLHDALWQRVYHSLVKREKIHTSSWHSSSSTKWERPQEEISAQKKVSDEGVTPWICQVCGLTQANVHGISEVCEMCGAEMPELGALASSNAAATTAASTAHTVVSSLSHFANLVAAGRAQAQGASLGVGTADALASSAATGSMGEVGGNVENEIRQQKRQEAGGRVGQVLRDDRHYHAHSLKTQEFISDLLQSESGGGAGEQESWTPSTHTPRQQKERRDHFLRHQLQQTNHHHQQQQQPAHVEVGPKRRRDDAASNAGADAMRDTAQEQRKRQKQHLTPSSLCASSSPPSSPSTATSTVVLAADTNEVWRCVVVWRCSWFLRTKRRMVVSRRARRFDALRNGWIWLEGHVWQLMLLPQQERSRQAQHQSRGSAGGEHLGRHTRRGSASGVAIGACAYLSNRGDACLSQQHYHQQEKSVEKVVAKLLRRDWVGTYTGMMELLSVGAQWHAEYALSSESSLASCDLATPAAPSTASLAGGRASAAPVTATVLAGVPAATHTTTNGLDNGLGADVRLLQRILRAHSWYESWSALLIRYCVDSGDSHLEELILEERERRQRQRQSLSGTAGSIPLCLPDHLAQLCFRRHFLLAPPVVEAIQGLILRRADGGGSMLKSFNAGSSGSFTATELSMEKVYRFQSRRAKQGSAGEDEDTESSWAEGRLQEIGLPRQLCRWLLRQRLFRRSKCPLGSAMNWLLDHRNQEQVAALIEKTALDVPIEKEAEISLDTCFNNSSVSMQDGGLEELELRHDSRGHRAGLLAALQCRQQPLQLQIRGSTDQTPAGSGAASGASSTKSTAPVKNVPQTQQQVAQQLLQALLKVLEEADSHDRESDDPFSSDALPTKGLLRQHLLLPLYEGLRRL